MKRTREDQPASGYPTAGPAPTAAPASTAAAANTPSPTAARAPPQPVRATATAAPPAAGMPKVQDALGYLDKVKVGLHAQHTHEHDTSTHTVYDVHSLVRPYIPHNSPTHLTETLMYCGASLLSPVPLPRAVFSPRTLTTRRCTTTFSTS